MSYNNHNENDELENKFLKVRFTKEINDLLSSLEEGDFLKEIDEIFQEKESLFLNILLDSSLDRDHTFKILGVKDIKELNEKMSEDRIFKRIIKILAENNLSWEIRQNIIKDRTIKGYMIQLKIYKRDTYH